MVFALRPGAGCSQYLRRFREEIGLSLIRIEIDRGGSGQGQPLLGKNQLTDDDCADDKKGGPDAELTFDGLA